MPSKENVSTLKYRENPVPVKETGLSYVEQHANAVRIRVQELYPLLESKLSPLINSAESDTTACNGVSRALSPSLASIDSDLFSIDAVIDRISNLISRTDLS